MALNSLLKVNRRGGSSDGQEVTLRANEYDELLTAQGLPAYTEITRKGLGFTVQTSTLFAPLTAVPTTTAALEVWNQTTSGVDLVIDTLYAEQILATAAAQSFAIFAMVTARKAVPSLTALSIVSPSGQASYTPTVGTPIVTGVGTTVVANGWRPWGMPIANGTAAATPMNSWHAEVNGRLIVPPGCSLCLHVVGSLATASSFHVGVSGYSVAIDTAT